ncbi:MAG: histidine phosphatase family protein [Acidimicrobiia bacterium]|nr:histidine phosphatase family protein [Acidimicrobiia bacterium]
MAALVHLIRHAEVDNPNAVVCGSAPGFGLSPHGLDQARRVGRYLGPRPVVAIWSSPLERALRTAEEIAARSAVPVRVDAGLVEWSLQQRWQGKRWSDLERLFPGEIESYRNDPSHLPFADETLEELAERVSTVAQRLDSEHPHGDVVVVSHEDAIQAARLRLRGADLGSLHRDKPSPGTVITLRPGTTWHEETAWEPGKSTQFGDKADLRAVPGTPRIPDPTSA